MFGRVGESHAHRLSDPESEFSQSPAHKNAVVTDVNGASEATHSMVGTRYLSSCTYSPWYAPLRKPAPARRSEGTPRKRAAARGYQPQPVQGEKCPRCHGAHGVPPPASPRESVHNDGLFALTGHRDYSPLERRRTAAKRKIKTPGSTTVAPTNGGSAIRRICSRTP